MSSYCLIRYLGSKNRLAPLISARLHATGRDTLVDIFGGSAAVVLNSGFNKRIYNDIDGDLVNLFRVLGGGELRKQLLHILRWQPPSRRIFEDDRDGYVKHGFSFSYLQDPVDRARATLYRSLFTFGGKMRTGGFVVSASDRPSIKEIGKYQSILRSIVQIGEFFRNTVIENLHFHDLLKIYGKNRSVVLFADPPYPELPKYYSHEMNQAEHAFLAHELANTPSPVVCTFYECVTVRRLYPETIWKYESFERTKNSGVAIYGVKKKKAIELILTKPAREG